MWAVVYDEMEPLCKHEVSSGLLRLGFQQQRWDLLQKMTSALEVSNAAVSKPWAVPGLPFEVQLGAGGP